MMVFRMSIPIFLSFRVLYGNYSNVKNKDKISLLGKVLTKVNCNAVDGICGISNNWNFNCRRCQ